ncbi:hypothetical protein Q8G13_27575, partial [Klebsiella pneumoniae]|uniref:hypothetical protein n=1 Tax=Klebsiella pneumoniae TaxID=573 RepID=UPI00272F80D8
VYKRQALSHRAIPSAYPLNINKYPAWSSIAPGMTVFMFSVPVYFRLLICPSDPNTLLTD